MSFLDKAKAKAQELAGTVKDKVDDFKEGRKVEDLLQDLGRITYRQRTADTEPGDAATIEQLVLELKKLEAEGVVILKAEEPDEPTGAATTTGSTGSTAGQSDSLPGGTMAAPTGDGSPMPPPPPPLP